MSDDVPLTWQAEQRLELVTLQRSQRGGSTAHPEALKLPLAATQRLRLTPNLPQLRRCAAGLKTPRKHARNQAANLQAHGHDALHPQK